MVTAKQRQTDVYSRSVGLIHVDCNNLIDTSRNEIQGKKGEEKCQGKRRPISNVVLVPVAVVDVAVVRFAALRHFFFSYSMSASAAFFSLLFLLCMVVVWIKKKKEIGRAMSRRHTRVYMHTHTWTKRKKRARARQKEEEKKNMAIRRNSLTIFLSPELARRQTTMIRPKTRTRTEKKAVDLTLKCLRGEYIEYLLLNIWIEKPIVLTLLK